MPKADEETESMRKELANLAEKCREAQKKVLDTQDFGPASHIPKSKAVVRKSVKGHINKVTCCHFSGDSRHAVTGSLDGKLIVWDCWTGNKTIVNQINSKDKHPKRIIMLGNPSSVSLGNDVGIFALWKLGWMRWDG